MVYRVAVVRAPPECRREMLNILAEREFPRLTNWRGRLPASTGRRDPNSATGKMLKVQNIEHFDFTGWDIALFAAGSGRQRSTPARRRRAAW